MSDSDLLTMLKLNLEIIPSNTARDSYLAQLLQAARQYITTEGITLDDSIGDGNLVVMYAGYLYRKRADASEQMPRMLRYALNNRLFAEKMNQ